MANVKEPVADGVPNPPYSLGEPSEVSHYDHSLTALVVNDMNNLQRSHAGEPHQLQQGENWLRFAPPANGNVVLESIDGTMSDQSFICVDVDRQVAAIKDLRTKDDPTAQDSPLEIHLSRRIRKRDRVETFGPNANHKPSEAELGGYDSDDENEGDDFATGRPQRPKKYHPLEALPRRQMRILHQGDRIVLKTCNSQQNDDIKGMLEYRHHRMIRNAVAFQKKDVAFASAMNPTDGVANAVVNGRGEMNEPPQQGVTNMLKPAPAMDSSGTTSVSTSKAVIVPPGMYLEEKKSSNIAQQRERSVDYDTDNRSYLTGEVLVDVQGYVSAITGDEETTSAERAMRRNMEVSLQIDPAREAQPQNEEAQIIDTPENNLEEAGSQNHARNGDKLQQNDTPVEAAEKIETPDNDAEMKDSQDRATDRAKPPEEEIPIETAKTTETPENEIEAEEPPEKHVAETNDGKDCARNGGKSQEEEIPNEAAVSPPKEPNAVGIPVIMEVNDDGDSSTSEEDLGDPTQAFSLPVGLSTQLSADEQVSDDETTMEESPQPGAKASLQEQSPVDPYDQPTQPLLFSSQNDDDDKAGGSADEGEDADIENKNDVDNAMQDEKPQSQLPSARQGQLSCTPTRSKRDGEKGTPCSDTSRNLLEDLDANKAESDKPDKALETTLVEKGVDDSPVSTPANGPGTQPLSPHDEPANGLSPHGDAFDYGDQDEQSNAGHQALVDEEPAVHGSDDGIGDVHQVSGGAMMTGPVGSAEGMNCSSPHMELPAHMKETPQNINKDPDRNCIEKQESTEELPERKSSKSKSASDEKVEESAPDNKGERSDPSNEGERSESVGEEASERTPQTPRPTDPTVTPKETMELDQTEADAALSPSNDIPVSKAPPLSQPLGDDALPENESVGGSQHGMHATETPGTKVRPKTNGQRDELPRKEARSEVQEQTLEAPTSPPEEKHNDPNATLEGTKESKQRSNDAFASSSKENFVSETSPLSPLVGDNGLPEKEVSGGSRKDGTLDVNTDKEQGKPREQSRTARASDENEESDAAQPLPAEPTDNSSPLLVNDVTVDSPQQEAKDPETEESLHGLPDSKQSESREKGRPKDEKTASEPAASEPKKSSRKRTRRSAEAEAEMLLSLATNNASSKKQKVQRKQAKTKKSDRVDDESVKSSGVHNDFERKSHPSALLSTGMEKDKSKDAQSEKAPDVSISTPSTPSLRKRTRESSARKPSAKRAKVKAEAVEKSTNLRVITTGVIATPRHKMMIEKLGGVLLENIEDAADATHVIAGDKETPLRRTPKLMIGLCRTSNVVHMDWLVKSARARHALDCSDFLLLNEEAAEEKYEFSMRETLENGDTLRRRNEYVLSGWYVYVCRGVAGNKAPPENELRLIVDAADGKWLTSLAASKVGNIDPSRIFVVTSDSPTKKQISTRDVAKALRAGAHSVTTSWLFHCLIRQELVGLDR